MDQLLDITKALADETRIRILVACRGGSLCVCQIIELLPLAPSTVSKHLSILKQAGLLCSSKEGRWIYYALPGDDTPRVVREALAFVFGATEKDRRLKEDGKRLKAILKLDREDLCRTQRESSESCSSVPETPAAARWQKA